MSGQYRAARSATCCRHDFLGKKVSESAQQCASFSLLLLSILLVGLCVALGLPFVAPVTWALLLAVLLQPVYGWIMAASCLIARLRRIAGRW